MPDVEGRTADGPRRSRVETQVAETTGDRHPASV